MNNENTDKLFRDFPRLYNQRAMLLSKPQKVLSWIVRGIVKLSRSVGLNKSWLIRKIWDKTKYLRNPGPEESSICWGFECGDGWFDLIYKLSEDLSKFEDVHVTQVKEKWGSLRYYIGYGTDEVFQLIEDAEEASAEICDVCGKPGEIRGGHWLACRCPKHRF